MGGSLELKNNFGVSLLLRIKTYKEEREYTVHREHHIKNYSLNKAGWIEFVIFLTWIFYDPKQWRDNISQFKQNMIFLWQ